MTPEERNEFRRQSNEIWTQMMLKAATRDKWERVWMPRIILGSCFVIGGAVQLVFYFLGRP